MNDKSREQLRPSSSKEDPLPARPVEAAIWRYGLAVLSIILSLAATYLLQPYVFRTPLFFLAIMVSTWIGGIGPGLLTVLLAALSISFVLSPGGVVPTRFHDISNVAAFLLTALLVGWWSFKQRQVEYALRDARDALETRVQERTDDLRRSNERLLNEIVERRQAEEALRESEKKYRGVFEAAHDVMMLLDEHGNILDVNNRAEQALGYSKSELLRMDVFQGLFPPEDWPLMRSVLDDLAEGKVREYEAHWRRKDETTVYFSGTSAPRFSETGEFLSSICALRDITERKKTEEALQKYAKRLETLHEIDEGILNARSLEEIAGAVLHRVTELVPCRGAIITLLDYEAQQEVVFASQFSGESQLVSRFPISLADSWELNERLDDLRQGHVIIVDDVRTLLHSPVIQTIIADGVHSVVLAPLLVRGELIGEFDLGADHAGGFGPEDQDIIREVANPLAIAISQRCLFEEVVVSRDRLRLLKQQLVEAQEIERRRLAQELHDRIGQNLTALSINLNIMANQLPADLAANLGSRLPDSMTLVETTAEIIRDVTADLSSPVLDDYGLEAGCREYVQRYQQRTGIAVELQLDGVTGQMRPEEQLALYRIVQEALTNVAKHAQASQVTITQEMTEQGFRLVIADNGVGFNPDKVQVSAEEHGLGLLIIRDRAESIGGHLRVESLPGHGTRLIVELKR